jgi:hypothetical protein
MTVKRPVSARFNVPGTRQWHVENVPPQDDIKKKMQKGWDG